MRLVPLTLDSHPWLLDAWHRLDADVWVELMPDLDRPSERKSLERLRPSQHLDRWAVAATDGDRLLGAAYAGLFRAENAHLMELDVVVAPPARRAGVATALARSAGAYALAAGRRTVVGGAPTRSAGEAFALAVGATDELGETRSSLVLAGVDRGRLDQQAAQSAAAAPAYELVRWRDRCPDDLLDRFAAVRTAMNTAPLGGLDIADSRWDGVRVRSLEERRGWAQARAYTVAARHRTTGELAGFTEVLVFAGSPATGHQEDTAVVEGHRGHGLGLWTKVEMLRWLLVEETRLRLVTTWNAEENEHMLRINRWLGFAPQERWSNLQVPAARLAEAEPA